MTAKKAPSIETANGTVPVDATATYKLTLGKRVTHAGHTMRPTDKNIKVAGAVLLEIASAAPEGALIHAEKV